MAVIVYNIEVRRGTATVTQDVQRIDKDDTIIYTTSGNNVTAGRKMAIQFVTHGSPHAKPAQGEVFPLNPLPALNPVPVAKSNRGIAETRAVAGCGQTFLNRKSFQFACGEADPDGKNFHTWSGGGSDIPSGGDGN